MGERVCGLCGDRQCSDFAKGAKAIVYTNGDVALAYGGNVDDCELRPMLLDEAEEERQRHDEAMHDDDPYGDMDPFTRPYDTG